MRLMRRRRRTRGPTDEERTKLAEAYAARADAVGQLAKSRGRSAEVDSIVGWIARARAQNHFSQRVQYMIEHSREEH